MSENIQDLIRLNKQLLQRVDALEKDLSALQIKYAHLKTEHTDLKKKYRQLAQENRTLRAENKILKAENIALKAENKALREENEELKRRLNMHSKTSSIPPSKNPLGHDKNKTQASSSLRTGGNKKQGGQKGSKGKTLEQFADPDEQVDYHIDRCQDCHYDLSQVGIDHKVSRQVVDIPTPDIQVTEHVGDVKICPCCGKSNMAEFPTNVTSPIQYGHNIQAMLIYLKVVHLIPYHRTTQLMTDIMGLNVAKDTIANIMLKLSDNLGPFLKDLEIVLNQSYVKHVDETGLQVCSRLKYLHSLGTSWGTLYKVTDKRGDIFSGDGTGVLVHDEWKPYMRLDDIKHALCHAHHLRELKNIEDNHNEAWAGEMATLLLVANWHCEMLGGKVSDGYYLQVEKSYKRILKAAIKYHEGLEPLSQKKQGIPKRRKGHNLALRLLKYLPENLLFLKDERVPFTNNLAERDLRMCKVQQKISGTFRTQQGADVFYSIRSLIETARKMGLNIIKTIAEALDNKFPELPIPAG